MTKRCVRVGLVLLAVGAGSMAGAAPTATAAPTTLPVRQQAEDPSAVLSRYLTALAANPQSLDALVGAARAALALGDAQAALSFFGRAEEISPRDGRIKAGIGSSLLLMQQGRSALTFFDYATGLGVPEAELAGDRGLAFDLIGEPRRAQKDYLLALGRVENPEIRRRLALSLAISGDRTSALSAIDPQLRRQDRAAWRTRAFVLALTGDTAGATQAVQAVMPGQAEALRPFLARLPLLSASDRALAVHFGQFPGDSAAATGPATDASASAPVADPTSAGRPDSSQPPLGIRSAAAQPARTAPGAAAPDPGKSDHVAAAAASPQSPRIAAATLAPPAGPAETTRTGIVSAGTLSPPRSTGPPAAAREQPADAPHAPPTSARSGSSDLVLPGSTDAASAAFAHADTQDALLTQLPKPLPSSTATPQFSSAPAPDGAHVVAFPSADIPASVAVGDGSAAPNAQVGPGASQRTARSDMKSFADVAALVATLPDFPPPPLSPAAKSPSPAAKGVKPTPQAKKAAAALAAATPKESDRPAPTGKKGTKSASIKTNKAPTPKEPSRIWVQVAGGADRTALPREYRRLKAQAPTLFTGKPAWTTPLRATNRLLVGPFETEKDAQAFVKQLMRADLAGFSWTSAEGQEIRKLATD